LPSFVAEKAYEDIMPAVKLYSQFLPDTVAVQMEFMRWKSYWERQPDNVQRPDTVIDSLNIAIELGTYPALSTLLQIFATLPVTTATGERSFSSLKYIKSYLRSTMSEDRLNGLAHLYINRDIPIDYEVVIDEFGRMHNNRRLSFI
jgi:hypothetical protein